MDMDRDNAAWLTCLRSDGDDRQSAVSDLRELLLRSLRKSLSNRPFTDESLLEDAVQDSLMRILDRLDQFEGRSHFLTWATSIAIHVAMSEFRRRRWRDVSLEQVIADSNFMPERALDADSGPEVRLERKAVFEKLHELIEHQLTEKQRTALLAELKGMPLDEIARHLGSNRNAVYKLTHDARKKLKTGLEAAGFDAADISTATTG
jgi:RNA polymerase sigma-70 factor (ECF subfamily)